MTQGQIDKIDLAGQYRAFTGGRSHRCKAHCTSLNMGTDSWILDESRVATIKLSAKQNVRSLFIMDDYLARSLTV